MQSPSIHISIAAPDADATGAGPEDAASTRFPPRDSASAPSRAASKPRSGDSRFPKKSAPAPRSGAVFKGRVPTGEIGDAVESRGPRANAHPLAARPGPGERKHARALHLHPRDQSRGGDRDAREPRLHPDAQCRCGGTLRPRARREPRSSYNREGNVPPNHSEKNSGENALFCPSKTA